MVRLGGSASYDSNIFRLPDGVDVQAIPGRTRREERITRTFAGLSVDQPYGQQRFVLDFTVAKVKHDYYSYLDYDPVEYRGAWHWALTQHTTGTLSASRSESLVNYEDFRNILRRNLRVTESARFDAAHHYLGGWYFVGGLSGIDAKNEIDFVEQPSYRAAGVDYGLKYVTGAGTAWTLDQRFLKGDYVDQPLDPFTFRDDGFMRMETALLASWAPGGRSSVTGRVALVVYEADHFAQRNFDGVAFSLGYRWQPAARLSLEAAASRDLDAIQSVTASYLQTERVKVGATFQAAARTSLRAEAHYAGVDYRQPVFSLPLPQRHDDLYGSSLGADWRVLRNLTLGASLARERRKSNEPTSRYSYTIGTLNASIMF